jgi:hypothetical protein
MKIDNIEINGNGVARAITYNYPYGNINLDTILKYKLYNYLILFGIRVTTCDTSMPDDIVGGMRLRKAFFGTDDYWELGASNGSTDPSPYWITHPMSDAAKYGGTAWVKEGQYLYALGGNFHGYPSFAPLKPIDVIRWKPTSQQIQDAKDNKIDLSAEFEKARNEGNVIESKSNDTLIHRTWGNKLYKDSAGCQVFGNNNELKLLTNWANQHIQLYKKNSFSYTLMSKEQFLTSNLYTQALENTTNINQLGL